ncbi:hypothetical protein AEAC466_18555 [Asticcacaulis sp. AC466]|uniref:hypothetical protein n=1 Tax=Asticcacaulis sp. AC466 TaxID=1282362 RepID=UPI0003C3F637|nr:hypothetical protein [Asticcacaulis sp. AC466]ESQ82139.1 hypothetical protein AEAC466_18555 [Asticcacaulis sp. AC466]
MTATDSHREDSIRGLTAAEVSALPDGLAQAVPVAEVRLIDRHHWVSHLARLAGRGTQIVVRGRNIFWPGLLPDFGADPIRISLLAHELVHVWQYETGLTLWKYILRERGRYHYRIDGRAYTGYGYEQQAAMMEDWMRLRAGLPPRYSRVDTPTLERTLPFL